MLIPVEFHFPDEPWPPVWILLTQPLIAGAVILIGYYINDRIKRSQDRESKQILHLVDLIGDLEWLIRTVEIRAEIGDLMQDSYLSASKGAALALAEFNKAQSDAKAIDMAITDRSRDILRNCYGIGRIGRIGAEGAIRTILREVPNRRPHWEECTRSVIQILSRHLDKRYNGKNKTSAAECDEIAEKFRSLGAKVLKM